MELNNKIIIYQTADGQTSIDVKLDNDTVWLSQAQMSDLFQKDQSVIARHISNVFKEGELEEKSNMQILHNTFSKYKPTKIHYIGGIPCKEPAWYTIPYLGQQSAERVPGKGICREQGFDGATIYGVETK